MMKTLHFLDEQYTVPVIIKTDDSIIGYDGDTQVFVFRGITDFSMFYLAEGQEFDTAQPTTEEQLETIGMQLSMEKLMNMQNYAQKDEIINNLGAQVAQMKFEIMQLKGGGI